jgi:septal ring factor EnvC (AmiA/AmiB activator)
MPHREKERTLAELESNQAELRKNIETSKELIAKSDRLLDRYRAAHDEAADDAEAPSSND